MPAGIHEREQLRVTMYEGHVVIRADCLSRTRSLAKGQSATLSCVPERAAVSPASAAISAPIAAPIAPPQIASAAAPVAALAAAQGARVVPPEPVAAPVESVAAPSWRVLARQGSYKEGVAAAEIEGFDGLCESLPVADLLELATAERLASKTARATEAYLAIRRRFAGSDDAATAAFHLGQMAFDGAQAYAEAHRWFGAYLSERPRGALTAEALGRAMEAEQRMGDLASARATAATYLERYPSGAHVRLAKSLQNP